MKHEIDVSDTGTRLRALVDRLDPLDEIVLVDEGEPVAKIVPVVKAGPHARIPELHPEAMVMSPDFDDPLSLQSSRTEPRVPGLGRGKVTTTPDFADPLPDEIWEEDDES
jgi:antitoxin (DNA-binding transcriptional repressor) of toxin-antitoxin stability system